MLWLTRAPWSALASASQQQVSVGMLVQVVKKAEVLDHALAGSFAAAQAGGSLLRRSPEKPPVVVMVLRLLLLLLLLLAGFLLLDAHQGL